MIFAPLSSKQLIRGHSMPNIESPAVDDWSESESSTVSVGFASLPKGRSRSTCRGHQKSVSFDLSENIVHEPVHDRETYRTMWYTPCDLHGFRTLTMQTVLRFRREGGMPHVHLPPTTAIENTYEACLGMLYDGIEVLCPVETAQFRRALLDESFPTGLAAYTSEKIRNDIRMRRAKLHYAIKFIQQNVVVDNEDITEHELAGFIRETAENWSRPSRLFAKLIAENN